MEDYYVHVQKHVLYSEVSIPGQGCDLEEFNVQFAKGCDCAPGDCTAANTCKCIARYGPNYTANGLLIEDKSDIPFMECNSECACSVRTVNYDSQTIATRTKINISGDRSRPANEDSVPNQVSDVRRTGMLTCKNRLVQLGPRKSLEIFVADNNKGFGLRSEILIPKGSFICEYAGEVIGLDEAKLRFQQNVGQMNYVFVLREHIGDSKVIKTCVDPSMIGNIGRYINHSCQPNAAVVPVRIDNPVPKLAIFSICDIDIGEEITFDYWGGGSRDNSKPVDIKNGKICMCGTPKCRRLLPFENDLL